MMDLGWFLDRLTWLEEEGPWPPERLEWDPCPTEEDAEGEPWAHEEGVQMWVSLTVRAPDGAYEVAALECPVDDDWLPDVVGHAGWAATRSAGEALARLLDDLRGRYGEWPRRGVALASPTATALLSGDSPDEAWAAEDGSCLPDWRVAAVGRVIAEEGSLFDLCWLGSDDPLGHVPRVSVSCSILMHGPDGAPYEVADGDLLATGAHVDGDRFVLDLEAPWELVEMPGSPLLAVRRLALGPRRRGGLGPAPR